MMKRHVALWALPFVLGAVGQAIGAPPPMEPTSEPALHWANRIRVGGTIEVDLNHQNNGVGGTLQVGTVELTMDAKLSGWSHAHVLLLHEADAAETVTVDEANITLGNTNYSPLQVTAGRMALPFGSFETQMLSDPLTLTLAETKETALQIGFDRNGWHGSGYLFDGNSRETGESERALQFGFDLGYAMQTDVMRMAWGVGYINAMENSDTLSDQLKLGETEGGTIASYVGGFSTYAGLTVGPYTLIGEYIVALDDFEGSDTSSSWQGSDTQAWNAELGYAFGFLGREANVAVGYQGTKGASGLADLPETRYLGTASVTLEESTTLGFEYYHDEGYATTDTDSATLRLAVSF